MPSNTSGTVKCPRCGGNSWTYFTTYMTRLGSLERIKCDDLFKCTGCGKKATISLTQMLKSSREFELAQAVEKADENTHRATSTGAPSTSA